MKLLFLIEKLKASEVFSQYKEKNPTAYFFAGFFSIDLKTKNNEYHLDYSDKEGKIMAFSLKENIEAKPTEPLQKIPTPIKDALKIDIDDAENIAIKEAEKNGMKLDKIMAILQNQEGKVIWNLTCIHGIKILKMKIDSETGEILKSESINMMDFMKLMKK